MEQCRIHRTLLALPDYVFPAVMLVLGRPTQQQKARPKPGRCGLKHIVHENGYRRMDTGELRQMLAWKAEERPYADWLRGHRNAPFSVHSVTGSMTPAFPGR